LKNAANAKQISMGTSMKQHGPWKIVRSNEVYRDPWVIVHKDDVVRPDGQPGHYTVVTIKPGVSVIAVDDEQNIFLTREFHYGVGRTTIEAVSGGVEPGEDVLVAAKRELREEIGIEADAWEHLGTTDPFTSNVVSPTQLYLARKLRFVDQDPEGTEIIQRVKMPLVDAVEMVMRSEITHSPSCLAIMKAARLLKS
jgi:ADP-ribose pyrophosphatase